LSLVLRVMKIPLPILMVLLLAGAGCQKTSDTGVRFYLQWVQASDQKTPPTPSAAPAGRILCSKLGRVFKWKDYWELGRDSVVLRPGQKASRRVSPEREVELEMLGPERLAVRIYLNGKLVRSRTQPANAAFCVTGGDTPGNQAWFIVVRRDAPLNSGSI
jgi:hypothetical protein